MELLGKINCSHIIGDPPQSFVLNTCPRCLGKGSYGDISYDNAGRLNTISNIQQLNQQIEKILIETVRNSGYGFDNSLINGVIDSGKLLAIKRELIRVINYFINNQQIEKSSGYYYRTTEEVYSLLSADVFQDNSEPRKVIALVKIMTVSGQIVSVSSLLSQSYTPPSPTPPVDFLIEVPLVGNVTANTANVVWATTYPGTSLVIYGLTPDTMTNSVHDDTFTMYHEMTLTALEMETNYYCQIFSTQESTGKEIHTEPILFFTGKEITIQAILSLSDLTIQTTISSTKSENVSLDQSDYDSTTTPTEDAEINLTITNTSNTINTTQSDITNIGTDYDYTVT